MPEVRVRENENIESALKRFKKKIQKAGILSEIKRRERYEKPSVKRKRKSEELNIWPFDQQWCKIFITGFLGIQYHLLLQMQFFK